MLAARGQILIAIKTEISESIDTAPSEVEVEPTQTINEVRSSSSSSSFSSSCRPQFTQARSTWQVLSLVKTTSDSQQSNFRMAKAKASSPSLGL